MTVTTRFAPSPTGELHVGSAWAALASWLVARASGGRVIVRMEDLDAPRVVEGAAERILHDLAWLGLDWDEGPPVGGPNAPYAQSQRTALYEAALDVLRAQGVVYPCDCSRTDIQRAASAPHAGEEAVYPGTCQKGDPLRLMKRPAAMRLRVTDCRVRIEDRVCGVLEQDVEKDVGDFVLRRGDGVFAYQLAVVVDDAAMGVSDVVRGFDLWSSTPRQVHLFERLGLNVPRYWHVPIVLGPDGERLAKRRPSSRIGELRRAGIAAEEIVGELAFGLGWLKTPRPCRTSDLIGLNDPTRATFRREPWLVPSRWARLDSSASER